MVEGGMRSKTRSAVAVGAAKSPCGTIHIFVTSSGITLDGCSDTGMAVLRGAMKHTGVPGHSETSPAIVSDSPCSSNISPMKIKTEAASWAAIRVAPPGDLPYLIHGALWPVLAV